MASSQNGFTLIEQMIVLLITAVLTISTVPSLHHLFKRTQTRIITDQLIRSLRQARTYAIEHNTDVTLCPSKDGETCLLPARWTAGWIAMPSNNDAPITYVQLDGHTTLLASRGRSHVRFRPNGSAAGTNTTFTLCPEETNESRKIHRIIVSNTGRIRQESKAFANDKLCMDA